MLIEVVFLDLSDTHGCSLYSLSEMKRYAAITSFTYGHSLATTAPGVISAILECQEKLEYSDEDLKTEMTEYMKGLSVPIQIFTIEECIQIIFFERDRNKQKLIGIYANAERRFKQRYS
jgi:hypothetical protein